MKNYKEFLNDKNPVCRIDMGDLGSMDVELFPEVAPITVKNFLDLVSNNFYNGIIFHRVIEGFMIQGGDPTGTGTGGSKNKIKGEFIQSGVKNELMHSRGVISMARTMIPDSASSQFFIMHQDAPHLDGAYAAFGIVTSGSEVVDKIAASETNRYDKPLNDIVIKEIVRIR